MQPVDCKTLIYHKHRSNSPSPPLPAALLKEPPTLPFTQTACGDHADISSDGVSLSTASWSSFPFSPSPPLPEDQVCHRPVGGSAQASGPDRETGTGEECCCTNATQESSGSAAGQHLREEIFHTSRESDPNGGHTSNLDASAKEEKSYEEEASYGSQFKMKAAETNPKKQDSLKILGPPKKTLETEDQYTLDDGKKSLKTSLKNFFSVGSSGVKERYLDLPVEEYDKVESCESRGLKLTFRRKSTERPQQPPPPPPPPQSQVKEKKVKPPQNIPKLIVQRCKCPEGYSKKELQCSVCRAQAKNGADSDRGANALATKKEPSATHNTSDEGGGQRRKELDKERSDDSLSVNTNGKTSDAKHDEVGGKTDNEVVISNHKHSETAANRQLLSSGVQRTNNKKHKVDKSCDGKQSSLLPVPGRYPSCKLNEDSEETERRNTNPAESLKDLSLDPTLDVTHPQVQNNQNVIYPQAAETKLKSITKHVSSKPTLKESFIESADRDHKQPGQPNLSQSDSEQIQTASLSDYTIRDEAQVSVYEESPPESQTTLLKNNPVDFCIISPDFRSADSKSCVLTSRPVGAVRVLSDQADTMQHDKLMVGDNGSISPAHRQTEEEREETLGHELLNCYWQSRRPRYRRSDSAPPLTTLTPLLSVLNFSRSRPSTQNLSLHYATTGSNQQQRESILLQEGRPKSSPPIFCDCSNTTVESTSKKSPVVILDRLPSPVIELYSMQNMNIADAEHLNVHCDNISTNCEEDRRMPQEEDSGSDWNSSDLEFNGKSSGNLKFTYRKVAHKRKYRIKSKKKSQTLNGENLSDSVSAQPEVAQTRRLYFRASKRGVRYVNDDDILEDIMAATFLEDSASMGDSLYHPTCSQKSNSFKKASRMKPGRKKKMNAVCKAKTKTPKSCAHEAESENMKNEIRHGDCLVDPRIKAMSNALLRACEANQNAENIAFGKTHKTHKLGRPEKCKNNSTKRKIGEKIRKQYSQKKLCYRQQQREVSNPYNDYDECSVHFNESKCQYNTVMTKRGKKVTLSPKHEHEMSKTKDSVHGCVQRSAEMACNIGKICSSSKYRNLFESDVFSACFLEDADVAREHRERGEHFGSNNTNCGCFSRREAAPPANRDDSERYKHFGYDSRMSRFDVPSARCQRSVNSCTKCSHNATACSMKSAEEDSQGSMSDQKYDDLDQNKGVYDSQQGQDNFIKSEMDSPYDSPEDYSLKDSALCSDPYVPGDITRDVDLMGLDYSKNEDASPECLAEESDILSKERMQCGPDCRCFDLLRVHSLGRFNADSYYFDVPVSQNSLAGPHFQLEEHKQMSQKALHHCRLSAQTKAKPSGSSGTTAHLQLSNSHDQPSANNAAFDNTPVQHSTSISKPLSILICPSPEQSDYGSPPSLTEYTSSSWCPPKGGYHVSGAGLDYHYVAKDACSGDSQKTAGAYYREDPGQVPVDQKHSDRFPQVVLPRIIVSSPSSTNTQSNETPSSASPCFVSYSNFLSPGLLHVRRPHRCESPFRLPCHQASPTKLNREDLGSRQYSEDKQHRHLKAAMSSPKNGRGCLPGAKRGSKNRLYVDIYADSDDSDSTLLYPTVDKRGQCCGRHLPSRRSSIGLSSTGFSEGSLNSAMNSPNMKIDDRCGGTTSPERHSIEKRQSELSTIVSDLRESISKSKAMKRSRRTNSFSGDTKPMMYEADTGSQRRLTTRPSFERFMSIDAMMDSDTPYASVTKRVDSSPKCEEMEMMRYVSGLCLQRKQDLDNSVSTASVAETQLYGIDYSHTNHKNNDTDMDNSSRVRGAAGHANDALVKREIIECLQGPCPSKNNNSNVPADGAVTTGASDESPCDDEKHLVVIDNAESNEVIEGDEAYHKVITGTYRLPRGYGNRLQKSGRRLVGRRPRGKERGLISVRSLLSRKPTSVGQQSHRDNRPAGQKVNKSAGRTKSERPMEAPGEQMGREKEERRSKVKTSVRRNHREREESGEVTGNCTPKRRRKHPEGGPQTLSKSESPDLLAEQINQSSAARILQELPRYNWLEQKILQKNSYNPVPGVVNLSTSQSQESSKTSSIRSQVSAAAVAVTLTKSSKSSPGIVCDIQDGSSRLNQKHAEPGFSSKTFPDESNRKGMQTSHSEPELMPLAKFDGSNMTTLMEKPSSLTSDILSTRSELSSVQPILDYDLCPTSPDDLNEESGLTIDLGHVDETDCSVSDAMSPVAEVDVEISKATAPSSSTVDLLERPADSQTNCIAQVGLSLVTTPIKLSASSSHLDQLDLTLCPAVQDDRSDEAAGSSAVKLERDDKTVVPGDAASASSLSLSDTSVDMTKSSCAASFSMVTMTTSAAANVSLGCQPSLTPTATSSLSLSSSSSSSSAASTTASFASEQDLKLSGPDGATSTGLAHRSSSPSMVHPGRGGLAVRTANISTALAITTTTTTTASNSVMSSPSHIESTLMPLDLCLKKSETLTTTNSRVKGHPPVQMVLPQIQHKTVFSPHVTVSPTSPITTDIKISKTSSVQLVQELDSKQSDITGDDILATKVQQRTSLDSEFKVETACPLHADTLDLCIKTSNVIRSLPTDPQPVPPHPHHLGDIVGDEPVIDERITIGLALSAELETEADQASKTKSLDVEMSLRTLAQANVSEVETSLKPDIADISLSASYQDISKTMTDAELDQEFQKHLIEFKALEKLAERKAQEQMQVAIMRKRKAAMLRIMEMKKAKRDFERVGQVASLSQEKPTVPHSSSFLLSSPSVLSPPSSVSTMTVSAVASANSATKPPGRLLSPCSEPRTATSSLTAVDCPSRPPSLTPINQAGPTVEESEKKIEVNVSDMSIVTLSPGKIKTEVSESDSEQTVPVMKIECKNELMEIDCSEQNETKQDVHKADTVTSESHSRAENLILKDSDTGEEKVSMRRKSTESNDKEKPAAKKPRSLLTPTPAHQNQPQTVHLEVEDSPASSAYSQGPYHRRTKQINEPPFISKDTPKDDQPQKAHNQRPFQTAGNLIVPNSASFPPLPSGSSPDASPGSMKLIAKQDLSQSTKAIASHSSRTLKLNPQPPQKSSSRSSAHSDGSGPQAADMALMRTQRKSLDDSDLRLQSRGAPKPVLDSGPKSADQVNKSYQPFQQGINISDKRGLVKISESGLHSLQHQSQQQQQQQQSPMRQMIHASLSSTHFTSNPRSSERPSLLAEEGGDKQSAFKAHVRPQNNLVIDLTRDSRPSSGELILTSHHSSPMDDRLQFSSRPDTLERRNHPSLPVTGPRMNNAGVENIPASAMYPEFHEKGNAPPNGFNTDRSRPGGFLTNQHRLPTRLERPIPVKDALYMRDQARPTMSTVAQHRQRYLDPAGGPEQHLTISGQPGISKSYHKGGEELSPSYMTGPHLIAPAWVDDPHHPPGAEFPSGHAAPHWRGHSPTTTSRRMEVYGDMDVSNRMLADDLEKQRNRVDAQSAFHKHADLAYKQKQLDAGIGYSSSGLHHALPHTSLHHNTVALHQQPIVSQNFQARSSHSIRHQGPQPQSQQHQPQKVRGLPPLDGMQPSWRSFGSVDGSMSASGMQPRTAYLPNQPMSATMPGIQDPLAYQKLQQQQQHQIMQHQQQQQQYQFQQLQGRTVQKILSASQGSSPTGQRLGLPHPPPPAPPTHSSQSLAIPQLMFSDSSPSYPNISPTGSQTSGLVLSQNQNLHQRSSDPEHLNMLRQRQIPKHPIFEQRPCPPAQPLAAPPAQGQTMLQSKTSPITSMPGPPRPAPVYPSISQGLGHPPSITNSLCRVCGNVAVYLCSSCRRVWYCNLHCQTKDWSVHATECKPAT